MKLLSLIFALLAGTALLHAEEAKGPFSTPRTEIADKGRDKASTTYLTDHLLEDLGERRLDNGTGIPGLEIIRITILRSFHPPLVFTWSMKGEQEATLHAKRAKPKTDEREDARYVGLDIDSRLKLRPSQNQHLKAIWQHVDYSGLERDCWQGASLDGSLWIYEVASENGHSLIARHNPINPAVAQSAISKERLLEESNLTMFALVVWTLAGIDDDSIY